VPDYLCREVQVPVLNRRGIRYQYYPVKEDLWISPEELYAMLTPDTAAVLLINYYGLRDHREVARSIRNYNPSIQIIEDNSQAFYGMVSQDPEDHWADFAFSSFQKSFAIPDGGWVRSREKLKSMIPESASQQGLDYLLGAILKHDYLKIPDSEGKKVELERQFLQLYDVAAEKVPDAAVKMTALSYRLLERYPHDTWVIKRRENYHFLLTAIQDISQIQPISPDLHDMQVPLFLPIRAPVAGREQLRSFLRQQQIYCPVHWHLIPELDRSIQNRAYELSQSILSLPIDHRLEFSDLDRLARTIRGFWRNQ